MAAKEQYVSVQAVSKAIADLESELGRSLFVRESRGVSPTPFGTAFQLKASRVLRDFMELEDFSARYQSGAPGEHDEGGAAGSPCAHEPQKVRITCDEGDIQLLNLALCTPSFHNNERARANIETFVRRKIGVRANVSLATLDSGVDDLRNKSIDTLITVGSPNLPHGEFCCMSIGTIPPGIVMDKRHPLAQKDTVSLADIDPYPVLISDNFDCFFQAIFSAYGTRLSNVLTTHRGNEGLLRRKGVTFAAGVPSLGEMNPHTKLKLLVPEDAISIPICLTTLASRRTASYCALERLFMGVLGASISTAP